MTRLLKLAEQMQKDWDRRVEHDHRFWMGAERLTDEEFWKSGVEDFTSLSNGIPDGPQCAALELGCGTGRIIKAASGRFGRVVGCDVSQRAIDKAREVCGENSHIELVRGNGFDLAPVESSSIDFIWSMSALACMPVPVIASYLLEFRRVVKPFGIARLQLYLGEEMVVHEYDTLHLRSFTVRNFERAALLAGFRCSLFTSVPLKNESDEELGVSNCVVTLAPTTEATASAEEIARALLPQGEATDADRANPRQLEAWMALNYADRLADEGDADRARDAVQYVINYCQSATIDTRDLLERVISKTGMAIAQSDGVASEKACSGTFWESNLETLREKFPDVYQRVLADNSGDDGQIELKESSEGPTVWRDSLCLDHAEKPKTAGEAWVKRALQESRLSSAGEILVVGFGGGYHLESLLDQVSVPVSCCEREPSTLRVALKARDLRLILSRLSRLVVGEPPEVLGEGGKPEVLLRPQSVALDRQYVERIKTLVYAKRGATELHPKIAVLGPFHGGTLPMTHYTANALRNVGQRVRAIDLSEFNGGFMSFDKLLGADHKRSSFRGQYVELVSSALLENLNEKPIDILICMAQAPISARTLLELRSRGVITVLWFVEDYLRFTYWKEMAKYYDFVFTIQKGECLDAIRSAGAGEVHYLPTACDPTVHRPLALSNEERTQWGSPLSFVGAGYHNRQMMFAQLSQYPFKIWGSEWPTCKPFDRLVQESSRRVSAEEYVKVFNATDINLNLHSSTERDGVDPTGDFVNPRTFELAACGAFQLVDERSLLPEHFEVGSEVVTFSSLSELKQLIEHYSNHPEERRAVCERARARVLRDHTYEARMREMLSVIFAGKYDHLRGRETSNPWTEVMRRVEPHAELKERCERARKRGEEANLDGLVADIVTGEGDLTDTEKKLLFFYHVRSQISRMHAEDPGLKRG